MNQPSNDISQTVESEVREWAHKARVAATSLYLAVPAVMAASPAYAHETEQAHTHWYEQTGRLMNIAAFAVTGLGIALYGRALKRYHNEKTEDGKDARAIDMVGAGLTTACGLTIFFIN